MKLAYGSGVKAAIEARHGVVALESTVIAHGLPRPRNLETARLLERDVRDAGATPATICLADGVAVVGAGDALLARLANEDGVAKVSTRDLAPFLARVAPGGLGATTVATTAELAARAGIEVFATGGIGGVHRGADRTMDVSADLLALSRYPVVVVCAGAKLVLDLAKTLERLETLGIPVIGYGTSELPAFYVRSSGLPVPHRVDDPISAARIAREQLDRGAGMLVCAPIPEPSALPRAEMEREIDAAIAAAEDSGIHGSALTPFLLARLGESSSGRTLEANVALLRNNARIAAAIATALAGL
ncbi:MAG TPA: pseudouridine-5'-phosphate glycosidase [Candidatus Limnocylindria bacterium]|nr:pseudouridine-5'-phosphate glycosidase [Candidatus Limnocylindria bacterium]